MADLSPPEASPPEKNAPSPAAPGTASDGSAARSRPDPFDFNFVDDLKAFGAWCRRSPVQLFSLLAIAGVLTVYLYGLNLFFLGTFSFSRWAWVNWDPEGPYGHCRLIPWIVLGLLWLKRYDLAAIRAKGSNWGLLPLGFAILLFIASVRTVQPRFIIISFPFLLYGSVLFAWGKEAARHFVFPSFLLFFLLPLAQLEEKTFQLQFVITDVVGFLARFFDIGIRAVGTTLTATDNTFNFEIAEGCSGIRSLAAMVMLTTVYVYLTQDRMWKKLLIFACSVGFAVIGNIGRIFTVVLVAKYYDPEFASGMYHDYSGYVFFPIAVVAMLLFAKFLNLPFFNRKRQPAA
ncbi:MAG TPA: exosortase/archaeosortase family protein [Chthoniobacteraceae bacterium]|nr:exosortase/archaeosortase family protein [Chthoniobacteraceae bacterium]